MYVSVSDRPGKTTDTAPARPFARVATTVILLGVVSLLTDVSSEMVNAVLPLYLSVLGKLGVTAGGARS